MKKAAAETLRPFEGIGDVGGQLVLLATVG